MRVLVGCTDLIFRSRIGEAVAAHGGACTFVRDEATLAARSTDLPADLVLLDLNQSAFRVAARAVVEARTAAGLGPVPIVGFYSHVDDETRRAALAAGCTEAMPRSAFVKWLVTLG